MQFSRLSGHYPRGRCRERGYPAQRPRARRGLSALAVECGRGRQRFFHTRTPRNTRSTRTKNLPVQSGGWNMRRRTVLVTLGALASGCTAAPGRDSATPNAPDTRRPTPFPGTASPADCSGDWSPGIEAEEPTLEPGEESSVAIFVASVTGLSFGGTGSHVAIPMMEFGDASLSPEPAYGSDASPPGYGWDECTNIEITIPVSIPTTPTPASTPTACVRLRTTTTPKRSNGNSRSPSLPTEWSVRPTDYRDSPPTSPPFVILNCAFSPAAFARCFSRVARRLPPRKRSTRRMVADQ